MDKKLLFPCTDQKEDARTFTAQNQKAKVHDNLKAKVLFQAHFFLILPSFDHDFFFLF